MLVNLFNLKEETVFIIKLYLTENERMNLMTKLAKICLTDYII